MLRGQMSPWQLESVLNVHRNLHLKFYHHRVNNSWNIADIEFPWDGGGVCRVILLSNPKFCSFYNVKERKHIEDSKSFETVIEGFYQGEEEERRIEDEIKPIFSRKNFIESKRIED